VRQQQTSGATERGEQQALGQHLPDETAAPGAEHLPHGKLAPAHRTTREQQVRRIRARDQQNQRGRAEEQRQHASHAARQVISNRQYLGDAVVVALWVLACEVSRQHLEL
jgi:hypothetical protein